MAWFRYTDEQHCILVLYIQPGAKQTEVVGFYGDALKIKLAAAPVEGKANAALLQYLARCFDVPRNHVVLKHGEKSRRKTVTIFYPKHSPDVLFHLE